MDERPQSANPVWQKRRILIVRRHNDPISLKCPEVLRQARETPGLPFEYDV